jgi:hypothetical protein
MNAVTGSIVGRGLHWRSPLLRHRAAERPPSDPTSRRGVADHGSKRVNVRWLCLRPPNQLEPHECDAVQDILNKGRSFKQTLAWTTVRPRHPDATDRWTWLIATGYSNGAALDANGGIFMA